jgi:preprotein translocase subunit SecA
MDWAKEEGIAEDEVKDRLHKAADEIMENKIARYSPEIMTQVEKAILLQTLDNLWREHLANLDHLRSVVGFRGYAQRDPLQEYKTEAFSLFETMLTQLRQVTTSQLLRVELVTQQAPEMPHEPSEMHPHHINPLTGEDEEAPVRSRPAVGAAAGGFAATGVARDPNDPATWGQVGRNEACPCGSGKKYKHCHGAFV